MINESNFIIKTKKNGNKHKQFKATCDKCNADRGYVGKSRADKLCRSCTRIEIHASWSPEKKKQVGEKATRHFIGSSPWNKGKTGVYSTELIKQWEDKHTEISSSEEYRKQMSCSKRGIMVFDEFSTSMQERERSQIKSQGLTQKCFERDDYTCQICHVRGAHLHAHHKNAFDLFPEQRFELNNLVTLCKICHTEFHAVYGKGQNTEVQFLLFLASKIKENNKVIKELYLLTGVPGSGKSWVISQLDNFNCLDSDAIPEKEIKHRVFAAARPLLSLTIGISTFMKNNPDLKIKLIVIDERIEILNSRILGRGGSLSPTIQKRVKRIKKLIPDAIFSGTSQEVLDFLKKN